MAKNNSKEQLENELNYTTFNLDIVDKDSKNNNLIALTTLNVQKVETMLRYNPDYPQFFDYNLLNNSNYVNDIIVNVEEERNNKKDDLEYPSFYYIKALEKFKDNDKKTGTYEYYIKAILRRINSENSTRASKYDITTIAGEIAGKFEYSELIENLKKPNKEYKIIEYICMKGKNRNLSLATKFCHYMSFILFFGTDDADAYSIFDSVINDSLNSYAELYGVNSKHTPNKLRHLYNKGWKTIKESYIEYQETINNIVDKTNISRNGFDHLVWYSNKSN